MKGSREHRAWCVTRRAAPIALALLLTTPWISGCGAPNPRAVILISIDTLRADHLGSYGHDLPTSPNIDLFAKDGVVFEDAMAPSPWTLPSHASLLTGLYPTRNGVQAVSDALPLDVPTLGNLLSEAGFETGAVVNSVFLGRKFGLTRGFGEELRYFEPDSSAVGVAAQVTAAAIEWLAPRREKRAFLFVHYFDVHSDYRSRFDIEREFIERRGHAEGSTAQLLSINEGRLEIGPEDAARLARLYDAGIRQLDEELGRLFGWLDAQGWREDTLVIVTSDHGEAFLEHGTVAHGRVQHQEVLHVPLLMRGPGVPAGVRVDTPVSLVDVAPTALTMLGLQPPAGLDGIDLRPLWDGSSTRSERTLFATGAPDLGEPHLHAVRSGRFKLIEDTQAGERQLYDLDSDPQERQNLAMSEPALAVRLSSELRSFVDRARPRRSSGLVPEDLRASLRALGYVD